MKTIYKYLITLGVGFAMAAFVAYSKNVFAQKELSMVFHILTDSFSLPAVLITGIGALAFVSNEGGFDALSYGLTSFFDMFRKEKKNKHKTFYDYKMEKAEKRLPVSFLLLSGLVFVAIMMIMYWLYTQYI